MRATWVTAGVWLLLLTGCRHSPPELKPQKGPEIFSSPPAGDRRYDSPSYPKEAFNNNKNDPLQKNQGPILPAQGGFGPGMTGRGF